MKSIVIALALAAAVASCEKSQSGPSARGRDTEPWDAARNPFVVPGWKSGDEASWESQIRNRTAGQNEYPRISPRS
jgi:hypothetical protein